MQNTILAFLGGGNMGEAMMKGLLRSGFTEPKNILVSEPVMERRQYLESAYGVRPAIDNRAAVAEADVIILAVKPQVLPAVVEGVTDVLDPSKLLISIAAGVPLRTIENIVQAERRLIRTMPNTPALAQEGVSALAAGPFATADDLRLAEQIFSAVGRTIIVDEHLLDAVTGLSGSGPAYVFMFIEALADGGVNAGLTREHALLLAAQTVLGSARLLLESGEHPGRLKDMVCSPAGTTIAGVHELERGGLRATVMNAVDAATRRSTELGRLQSADGHA